MFQYGANVKIVVCVFQYGANVKIVVCVFQYGANVKIAVWLFQYGANVKIVVCVFQYGANVKIVDHEGRNSLFYARSSGSQDCVELLRSQGCPENPTLPRGRRGSNQPAGPGNVES